MAYTKDDVARLMLEVGEAKAKRQTLLMHPPVVVVPYPGTDKDAKPVAVDADAVAATEMAQLERDSPPVEWEVSQFGLKLDMYDPVSGEIHTICSPKTKAGAEVFLTAKAVNDLLVTGRKPVLEKRREAAVKAAAAMKAESDRVAAEHAAAAKGGGTLHQSVPAPKPLVIPVGQGG